MATEIGSGRWQRNAHVASPIEVAEELLRRLLTRDYRGVPVLYADDAVVSIMFWGGPLLRGPESVRQDAIEEYLSVDGARLGYGVVIDPQDLVVLGDEARQERARRRAETEGRTGRGIGREQGHRTGADREPRLTGDALTGRRVDVVATGVLGAP